MEYYQILKNLREDADLKQKEISEKFFLGKNTYYNYENGKREMPFKLVVELAKYYKVSLDYIAGITNNKNGINDEQDILKKYNKLNDYRKGRIMQLLEMMLNEQLEENATKQEISIHQENNINATVNINTK